MGHRLHADALVDAVALQVPAARVPVRAISSPRTRRRGVDHPEYELVDTGVFDDDRYFDIELTYAKAAPEDICIVIECTNRGPDPAPLHVLPTLWFRNTWSWGRDDRHPVVAARRRPRRGVARTVRPALARGRRARPRPVAVLRQRDELRASVRIAELDAVSEGRHQRPRRPRRRHREPGQQRHEGRRVVPAHDRAGRDGNVPTPAERPSRSTDPFGAVVRRNDRGPSQRRPTSSTRSSRRAHPRRRDDVQRRALAGLLWAKKHYRYDVNAWLAGRSRPCRRRLPDATTAATRTGRTSTTPTSSRCPTSGSTPGTRRGISRSTWSRSRSSTRSSPRNSSCCSAASGTCIRTASCPRTSGPSTTSTRRCTHGPRGGCSRSTRSSGARRDWDFLERIFHKLLMNFSWWVNRKDAEGNNLFEGGFLGLDNIGLFDRSRPLPSGHMLEQSDATSWMAMYCLNMLAIAIELAHHDPTYEDVCTKFFEHFLAIGVGRHRNAPAIRCGTRTTASSTTCSSIRTAAACR